MTAASRNQQIPIFRTDTLGTAAHRPTVGVAINVYRSANYVVIDAGLPRCHAESIRVTLTPEHLLIEAERHPGEAAIEKEREYLVRELPYGAIGRVISLPATDLALHDAKAHFENGLLTVAIPTRDRDAYRHRVRGEEVPAED